MGWAGRADWRSAFVFELGLASYAPVAGLRSGRRLLRCVGGVAKHRWRVAAADGPAVGLAGVAASDRARCVVWSRSAMPAVFASSRWQAVGLDRRPAADIELARTGGI
jgi:hypothetical protein